MSPDRSSRLPGPGPIQQLPLLRRIFSDPQPVLDELAARYGGVCGMGLGPVRMAVVGELAALRELFALPTESFRWNHRFNVLGFVVGDGSMIVSDGPDHRRRRSSVQAAFSRRRLNGWIPAIVDESDAAIDRLAARVGESSGVVDLHGVGRQLVLRVVIRALFGPGLAERADEIGDLFARPQAYLESPAIRQMPHPFPFGRRAAVRRDRLALDAIIDAEIAARRRSPSGDPLDVLEALVNDGGLSDAEIRDQVVTLVGAGFDTTSASLAWMVWRAATEPGVWARLRAEADEVFGPLSSEHEVPDEHALARLDVAKRVMRETLRLHPAGVIAPREAAVDVTISGRRIRAGTVILWSAYLAGRDATAWPDPLAFDIDREFDDSAWVPFGRGQRNCLGFALAQMELTLMIARLAQRIDVDAGGAALPRPVRMVVNRPEGGVPMRVSLR